MIIRFIRWEVNDPISSDLTSTRILTLVIVVSSVNKPISSMYHVPGKGITGGASYDNGGGSTR